MSLKNSYFILCRPQLGENIGSSARALKNFNIPNLRIVNPRCIWPNQKAKATSVGAKNIIQSAKVFKSACMPAPAPESDPAIVNTLFLKCSMIAIKLLIILFYKIIQWNWEDKKYGWNEKKYN